MTGILEKDGGGLDQLTAFKTDRRRGGEEERRAPGVNLGGKTDRSWQ